MTALAVKRVIEAAHSSLPTHNGRFEAIGFFDLATGDEHLVLVGALGLGSSDAPTGVLAAARLVTGSDLSP